MKLFLDDVRNPSDCIGYMHTRIGAKNPIYMEGEWYIVRNFEQFQRAIITFHRNIQIISFDHDLADAHYATPDIWETPEKVEDRFESFTEPTGYECAKFFKEFFDENKIPYPELWVHSMNPVGTQRIINLFK